MKCFNYSCQGESHKASNKECQDYSLSYHDESKGIKMAIVCDGHGGDTYFRSSVGARVAAEITKAKLLEFIDENSDFARRLFVGHHFTQCGTVESEIEDKELDDHMRQLFGSIYQAWRSGIQEDGTRPLTEWEKAYVDPKHYGLLTSEERIVKAYGCTLMAYVATPDYWFAFHLGDGKCVMLDREGKFSQPIPWDERCFLNKTTSMCDNQPVGEFRYCLDGTGQFPYAIFLGSDGLDDTFGDGDKLNNYYGDLLRDLRKIDREVVEEKIKETLPLLSKKGSQDDMSVALVYDETALDKASLAVAKNIKAAVRAEMPSIEQKIAERKQRINFLETQLSKAQEDLTRAKRVFDDFNRKLEQCYNEQSRNEKIKKSLSDKLVEVEAEIDSYIPVDLPLTEDTMVAMDDSIRDAVNKDADMNSIETLEENPDSAGEEYPNPTGDEIKGSLLKRVTEKFTEVWNDFLS